MITTKCCKPLVKAAASGDLLLNESLMLHACCKQQGCAQTQSAVTCHLSKQPVQAVSACLHLKQNNQCHTGSMFAAAIHSKTACALRCPGTSHTGSNFSTSLLANWPTVQHHATLRSNARRVIASSQAWVPEIVRTHFIDPPAHSSVTADSCQVSCCLSLSSMNWCKGTIASVTLVTCAASPLTLRSALL